MTSQAAKSNNLDDVCLYLFGDRAETVREQLDMAQYCERYIESVCDDSTYQGRLTHDLIADYVVDVMMDLVEERYERHGSIESLFCSDDQSNEWVGRIREFVDEQFRGVIFNERWCDSQHEAREIFLGRFAGELVDDVLNYDEPVIRRFKELRMTMCNDVEWIKEGF